MLLSTYLTSTYAANARNYLKPRDLKKVSPCFANRSYGSLCNVLRQEGHQERSWPGLILTAVSLGFHAIFSGRGPARSSGRRNRTVSAVGTHNMSRRFACGVDSSRFRRSVWTVSFRFHDRAHAGRLLAEKLDRYRNRPEVIVLALPRGGVPVAFEVARRLNAPLDVFVARKLGLPGREELAMGAIASGGVCVLNDNVVASFRVAPEIIAETIARERLELERRERDFRTGPSAALRGRVVILVDDGLATGATMRAAVQAARQCHPARIIVAAPVAARETHEEFKQQADEIVCVQTPGDFQGVGQWYDDFTQTSDEEVRALLEQGAKFGPVVARPPPVKGSE